ncbi:MAG: hypothetical protein ACT4OM_07015 [Actinomycetota bacterium]
MRPFVDPNVCVYAHDRDEPVKREAALKLLNELAGFVDRVYPGAFRVLRYGYPQTDPANARGSG